MLMISDRDARTQNIFSKPRTREPAGEKRFRIKGEKNRRDRKEKEPTSGKFGFEGRGRGPDPSSLR